MIENKKGRKYDREKWGWKDESELEKHTLHPYYDNDRKNLTEKYSIMAITVSIISMVFLVTLLILIK